MSDSNTNNDILADRIDELQLDLHAARVAITVLSSVVSAMAGDRKILANSVKQGLESSGNIEFENEVEPDYQEKLKAKILELL